MANNRSKRAREKLMKRREQYDSSTTPKDKGKKRPGSRKK